MKKNKNKKEQVKNTKNHKVLNLLAGVIVGMFVCVTVYLIYNILKLSGIEDIIRYIIIGVLFLLCIFIMFKYMRFKRKGKVIKYIIFMLLLILFGAAEFYISILISKGVSIIDELNKDKVTYTSALIALKDGNYTTIDEIKEGKIAIISDTDDTEGYILAQKIIENNDIDESNLVEYDDYLSMLNDLYDENVDGAFVSGSYVDKFSTVEKFENISDEVIVLDSYSKLMKKQVDSETEASTKSVTEPFTILLLGVDSEEEDISKTSGLGDTIILVTFNPNTLNATMFSIPRDTYVPISCAKNSLSKITHAASLGGTSCMIKTVENFTGIDIDYYAKVNFTGLINLVDELGGIDVDVPYAFCESDENRSYLNTIYVDKGWQHLDGRQALALARNRKTVSFCGSYWNQGTRNDFVRGQNQQLVIKAIMNKFKTITSVNQLYSILDTISASLDTNLTRNQILDFYNVFKKVLLNSDELSDSNDIINIQKTYLNGSGGIIYDNVMNMDLYEYVPSTESLNAIVTAMKVNLELEEEEYDTSFSFSIDEPYEAEVIGADLYGGIKSYSSSSSSTSDSSSDSTTTITCGTNQELGADGVTCVCKNGYSKNSSGTCVKDEEETESNVSTCVSEGDYYYWYDSNGDKNSTKYADSTCSVEVTEETKANVSTCVSEGDYYYWYDSNGDKNLTAYSDSSCTTPVESE